MTKKSANFDKRKTIYNQLKKNPKNIRFNRMCNYVETFGFILDRIKGSHHIYMREGTERLNLQPDKNMKTKTYQVKQFLSLIEELLLLEKE